MSRQRPGSRRGRSVVGSRFGVPVLAAVMLLATTGCAEESSSTFSDVAVSAPKEASTSTVFYKTTSSPGPDAAATPAGSPAVPADGEATPPALPRKIVYNAQVDLVVESVTATAEKIAALVKEAGGYVSETDQSSLSHTQRRATWKVRVPVDRFDSFLAGIARLGELQRHHVDSQDVTQEYYDLDARIANKKEEEKRLLKHLADSTGKLEDILSVERELSRVRGEIEQMQGRLRYLANVTALSTVTISATETRDYVPPVAPTMGAQIERTFRLSLSRLKLFLTELLLFFVAIVPWLPVLAILGVLGWAFLRFLRHIGPTRPRR